MAVFINPRPAFINLGNLQVWSLSKTEKHLFIYIPIYSCGDTFDAMLENKLYH